MNTNKIYNLFKNNKEKSFKIKDLMKSLNIKGKKYPEIRDAVFKLLNDNKIIKKGNRFQYNENQTLIEGKLQMNRRGFGFVVPLDDSIDDLYIPPMKLNGAFDGDTVKVKEEYFKGKREGNIVEIVSRSKTYIIGLFVEGFVEPFDKHLPGVIKIRNIRRNDLDEKIVKCKIVNYDPLRVEIEEIIGDYDDPSVDDRVVINRHNLKVEFPDISEKYYQRLSKRYEKELKTREDLTNLITFTIDPEDAKDNDDSVSLLKKKNSWILYVHIADVSFYVEEGSPIDDIAHERGFSAYLIDNFLPMLPHKITTEYCSLKEGDTKLAITVKMTINNEGGVTDSDIILSKVKIDKVFSYKEVYEILQGKEKKVESEWVDNLRDMKKLAKLLKEKRIEKGTIDFDKDELKITLNEDKSVKNIKIIERNWAHKLIEKFMICANETVSSTLEKKDRESIFRIHEKPSRDKLRDFRELLEMFDIHAKDISIYEIREIMKKISDTPYESYLKLELLKSMKQAKYSYYNIGHYGLQSRSYTHFTSPIRRYSDLIIHRVIKGRRFKKDYLKDITKYLSEKERKIEQAERESYEIKILRYLDEQPKDTYYDGLVVKKLHDKLAIELINYQIGGIAYYKNVSVDDVELFPGKVVKVKVVFVDPIYRVLELKI